MLSSYGAHYGGSPESNPVITNGWYFDNQSYIALQYDAQPYKQSEGVPLKVYDRDWTTGY